MRKFSLLILFFTGVFLQNTTAAFIVDNLYFSESQIIRSTDILHAPQTESPQAQIRLYVPSPDIVFGGRKYAGSNMVNGLNISPFFSLKDLNHNHDQCKYSIAVYLMHQVFLI